MPVRAACAAIVVSGALVSAGITSPSFAAGSGTLTTDSGVLFECADHEYTYSLSLPAETEDWSMEVTIRSEDGLEATSDYVYGQVGASGSSEFMLCPSDGPGTYTMTATVTAYDSDYDSTVFDLPSASFDMRLPTTRTTLSASVKPIPKRKQKVVVLRTTTTDERPNGYYGTSYPDVVIQQLRGTSWITLPNVDLSMSGDGKGVARFTWPLKQKAVLRAHTVERFEDYTESFSSTVDVR